VQASVDSTNLVALRKACAEAKSLSSQKFSQSLSSLSLPLSPSYVKKECEKGMEAALKDFDGTTKEFSGTEARAEIRKELEVFSFLHFLIFLFCFIFFIIFFFIFYIIFFIILLIISPNLLL